MRRLKLFMPLLGLALVLALSGCLGRSVQGTKFTAFKDAAAAVTTQSQAAYDEVRVLWLTLGAECLAKPMTESAYWEAVKNMDKTSPCGADAGKDPKANMDVRLGALKALSNYAAAVSSLATTDYVGDFDASLAKFDTSLTSLENTLGDTQGLDLKVPKVATDAQNAIKKTVTFFGGLYLEKQRKQRLREALNAAQESLDALGAVFADDNMSIGNLERAYGEQYLKIRARLRKDEDHDKLLAYDAKVIAAYARVGEVRKVLDAQSAAVKAMPQANKALLMSLDNDDPGVLKNLEKYVAVAQEVHDIVQAWKKI